MAMRWLRPASLLRSVRTWWQHCKTTGNAGAQKEIAPPQQPASVICVWGNADFGCELAAVLAEHEDVLVIDADLLNPRADLILGCGQPKTTGSDPLEAGGLDLALTCESRGHLDVISLNQYIRSTRVKGVSALTTTSGPTQYESFQLNALAKVIHLARLICRFVVILCSAFIFDGFTCLGLRMADRVLVPVAADIGSFREKIWRSTTRLHSIILTSTNCLLSRSPTVRFTI